MFTKRLRVLVAEDSHDESPTSIQALLPKINIESPLDITAVASISTLLPSIKLVSPEMIFLDLSIAQPDASDVVRRLHRSSPGVPIIVLTDTANKESAAQCVVEGAADYILKEEMNEESVNRVFRVALESNTLAGLTDLLRDPLTGFYSRDAFLALGARSMDTGRRNAGSLVLLCARLKNFSSIRAEFGPAAADEAIQEVSEVLIKSFRGTDILARIGDAQFAVLAADALEPSLQILRQRIERRLAVYNQSRGAWGVLELSVSASYWSASDATTCAEFLDRVEAGLRGEGSPQSEHAPAEI